MKKAIFAILASAGLMSINVPQAYASNCLAQYISASGACPRAGQPDSGSCQANAGAAFLACIDRETEDAPCDPDICRNER